MPHEITRYGRKTGKWRAEVQHKGRRRRGVFPSREEAEEAERRFKEELTGRGRASRVSAQDRPQITLAQAFERIAQELRPFGLEAVVRTCSRLQELSPTMPVAMLEAFFLVARYEGRSLGELCRISGKPQSTLSRHLLDLGRPNRRMGPGIDLVEGRIDPRELKRKQYVLTARGRELVGAFFKDLVGEEEDEESRPSWTALRKPPSSRSDRYRPAQSAAGQQAARTAPVHSRGPSR